MPKTAFFSCYFLHYNSCKNDRILGRCGIKTSSEFKVQSSDFKVQSSKFRVQSSKSKPKIIKMLARCMNFEP
jgi:hypothetical protein